MAQLGMDVDAVESAGRELQAKAQSIDALISNLDKTVASLPSVWEGKDAQTFINEWWPEHKKALTAASSSVAGLGQSALNNASEQRKASGVRWTSTLTHVNSSTGTNTTPAPATSASVASPNQARMESWASNSVGKFLDVDPRFGPQCYGVINNYSDTLFPGVSHFTTLPGMYAKDVFANANPNYFQQVSASSGPQPGDIVCIGANSDNEQYGHVAVVESVDASGIHVIEQNGNAPTQPTYEAVLDAKDTASIQGYLRPKTT